MSFKKNFSILFVSALMISCAGGKNNPITELKNSKQAPGNKTGVGGSEIGSGADPVQMGPTYADVLPIFEKNCKTCHAPGGFLPDWLNYDIVVLKIDALKNRVLVKKDMPSGGIKLTQDELQLLETWLNAGAPKGAEEGSSDGEVVDNNPPSSDQPTEPIPVTPPEGSLPAEPPPPVAENPTEPDVPSENPQPEPIQGNVTFAKDISSLFDRTCKMCHNPDTGLPDWSNYDISFASKDKIMNRVVVVKDMPMAMPMTDQERELVKTWIEQGALKE